MELISREALKSKLQKNIEELADKTGFFEGIKLGYESALHFVEQAPTVEERKHGRWEGGGAYYCSNCNAYAATDVFGGGLDITEQHYCYNCGNSMEEKKDGISNE